MRHTSMRQTTSWTLQWRHNGIDGVSNHQPHHCLLSRLFGRRSKKTSKLRVTGLCAGNSLRTGEFPAQMASNAEMFPFDDVIMKTNYKGPPGTCLQRNTYGLDSGSVNVSKGLFEYHIRHLNTRSRKISNARDRRWEFSNRSLIVIGVWTGRPPSRLPHFKAIWRFEHNLVD